MRCLHLLHRPTHGNMDVYRIQRRLPFVTNQHRLACTATLSGYSQWHADTDVVRIQLSQHLPACIEGTCPWSLAGRRGERLDTCSVQIFGRGGQATVQLIARAARATTKTANHIYIYRYIYIYTPTYPTKKQTNVRELHNGRMRHRRKASLQRALSWVLIPL